jgi:hypothetical protein
VALEQHDGSDSWSYSLRNKHWLAQSKQASMMHARERRERRHHLKEVESWSILHAIIRVLFLMSVEWGGLH